MKQVKRIRLAIPMVVLLGPAMAYACPAPQTVYTREEDGAVFHVERYGKREGVWPSWHVYKGLFRGRVAYVGIGVMANSRSWLSTSGYAPPVQIVHWDQETDGLRTQLLVFEGPLQGEWNGKCVPVPS